MREPDRQSFSTAPGQGNGKTSSGSLTPQLVTGVGPLSARLRTFPYVSPDTAPGVDLQAGQGCGFQFDKIGYGMTKSVPDLPVISASGR